MGVVQVRLPEDVSAMIEREIAAGNARSAEDYVLHVLREYMSSEDELAAEARAGIEDIEAGRYVVVDHLDEWGRATFERVRQQLEEEPR